MQIHFFIKRNDIGAFVVNRCNVAVDKAPTDEPSGVCNFLPFLAAASEAKKLKTNQYLVIALATVIMYPTRGNAAAAGCYFKANSKSEKTVIGGAVLSGFLGITEPALFGVLTKYKMAFAAVTVGSVVGSAFISFFDVRLYGCITFGIPACIGPYFPFAVLGWIITLAISFSLSYLLVVKRNRS